MKNTSSLYEKRKKRVRFGLKVKSNGRLRLSVFRSSKHIYAQVIDDSNGVTLASASTVDKELRSSLDNTANVAAAEKVGTLLAARAIKANVKEVVFDRGAFMYHGRVKALAEAARVAGLSF